MSYNYFVENILNNNYVFYFDTNTLLGLYKKSDKIIEDYSKNLEKVSNSIRIPSTVLKEYRKNENQKKAESKSQLEKLISAISSGLSKIDDDKFKKLRTDLKSNGSEFDSNQFDSLVDNFISQCTSIKEFMRGFNIEVNSSKNNIVSNFIETFIFHEDHLLPRLSRIEKNKFLTEGYTRMKHHLPPGYMDVKNKYHKLKKDAAQDREPLLKPEELMDYLGDYFIWGEILKDVKANDTDALFITSDLKEDWWNIPDDRTELESYSPREELIEEFVELTNKRIEFIPFDLFISYLEIYNQQGIVANYLARNTVVFENQFSQEILSLVQDRVDTDIVYGSIVYDSELTRGYAPYHWSIQSDEPEIDWIEVSDYEELEDGGILFQLNISVNCYGEFELDSGLEGDVYHSVSGDFTVSDIIVYAEIKISSTEVEIIKGKLDEHDNLISIDDIDDIDDIEISELYIDDSGNVDISYEDPEEKYLMEYYKWLDEQDERRFCSRYQ